MKYFAMLAALAVGAAAQADLVTGFELGEGYNGSPGGSPLTFGFNGGGQQGWYNPVNGSLDQNVYTYAGNALGFPANPKGGEQFIGMTTGANNAFPRAQHAHDFSTSNVWTISYDFAAKWLGQGASAPNLSSFSLQPSVSNKYFIALNNFMDVNNPNNGWKAEYNVFDANNNPLNNQSPGAAWTNLAVDHWYRQSTTVDFSTNLITEVSLTDLTTNVTFTANPVGWYMYSGAAGFAPLPTDVRFFEGGAAGNTMGWDNLRIVVPAPGAAAWIAMGLLTAGRRRR